MWGFHINLWNYQVSKLSLKLQRLYWVHLHNHVSTWQADCSCVWWLWCENDLNKISVNNLPILAHKICRLNSIRAVIGISWKWEMVQPRVVPWYQSSVAKESFLHLLRHHQTTCFFVSQVTFWSQPEAGKLASWNPSSQLSGSQQPFLQLPQLQVRKSCSLRAPWLTNLPCDSSTCRAHNFNHHHQAHWK